MKSLENASRVQKAKNKMTTTQSLKSLCRDDFKCFDVSNRNIHRSNYLAKRMHVLNAKTKKYSKVQRFIVQMLVQNGGYITTSQQSRTSLSC